MMVAAIRKRITERSKVKTGCATCRIRKIKCDEGKPYCQKCVHTGRTCDGYESPFRICVSQPNNNVDTRLGGVTKLPACSQADQPVLMTAVSWQDVALLNHCFSSKTMFDVNLGCDEEAKQVLQASLSDPSIQHAVSSLKALRENLDRSGDDPKLVAEQTPEYSYGLEQYNMALRGLASNLSTQDSHVVVVSALLCCQIFISIEQVRGNFGAMAQHIIRGLSIMHQHGARPNLAVTANELSIANHQRHPRLPLLDVFVVKLFAAPCKFTESPATANASETSSPARSASPHHEQPAESPSNLRTIAPNMRTGLTRIAALTLEFLDKASRIESVKEALDLRIEKTALLDSLGKWLADLEQAQSEATFPGAEPLSVSFMRLFHQVLIVVLLEALDYSSDGRAELQVEIDRLQGAADYVGQRFKAYKAGDANLQGPRVVSSKAYGHL